MEKIEITSISSKGQIVIPQKIRQMLHLYEGEKFMVIGEDDTIVLKKLEIPSFKGFDKLLEKTRKFVKKKHIEKKDIEKAIQKARKK